MTGLRDTVVRLTVERPLVSKSAAATYSDGMPTDKHA